MKRITPMLRPGIRRLLRLDVPRRDVIASQLEDELRLHLDLRTEQLMQRGLTPEAAAAEARTRYGPIDSATSDIRRHAARRERTMRRRIGLDSLVQDIRFALRTLGRQKAWTAVAIVTLALGIGANTAVFSVVNDLLLDPLRYPGADRIVLIYRVAPASGIQLSPTPKLLEAWKAIPSFEGMEGIATADVTLSGRAEPRTANAIMISPTFVRFAGARLLMGRTFLPEETVKGGPPVTMLSEHVWRRDFGASPGVLGTTIKLDGTSRVIVGVLADGVRSPSYSATPADVWLPLTPDITFLSTVAARLRPAATVQSAEQALRISSDNLNRAAGPRGGMHFEIVARRPGSTGTARQSVLMLAGAVALLLLIACANVAHLLLARGAARERELSIRAALGAGRGRIVRQLLTECMLLAVAGCGLGLAIGYVALQLMVKLRPPALGTLANVHIDGRVLAATIGVSILTGIAFGLVAGLAGSGSRRFAILRSSVSASADRRRHRLRSLLVVSENALSVVLVVGAVMLIRTVMNLHAIDPGFDPRDAYAMTFTLPESRYRHPSDRQLYEDALLAQTRRIPGVTGATVAANVPSRSGVIIGGWEAEGAPEPTTPDAGTMTAFNTVRPEYFSVMRMPLVAGRAFDAGSVKSNEVIVSRAFARQLWGNTDVVGRRFRTSRLKPSDDPGTFSTVVGVAPDAALLSLHDRSVPALYYPTHGEPDNSATLIVRMQPDRTPFTELRRISLMLDRDMPPPAVVRLTDLLMEGLASQRFMMTLLTLFAGLAVVLSAIGLYGVVAYMVTQSTREIGIRVALGAARRDIVRLVMREGAALCVLGLAIGLGASLWGTKLLQGSLYGVTTTDPSSYVVGSVVLLALAGCACIAPARRAMRIDPMVAMRAD